MIIKKQHHTPDKSVNPLIGILLFLISILLFIITVPFGFVYGIFHSLLQKGLVGIGEYLLKMAVSIDQLGNVAMQHLLNLAWVKKGGYKFGNRDETISSALGRNNKLDTLTGLGRFIDNFLNLIDRDHSLNSIDYYIEPTPEILDLVSWLCIVDFRVLVLYNKKTDAFSIPGGYKVKRTSDAKVLQSHMRELLGIELIIPSLTYLGVFEAQTSFPKPIILERKNCYTTDYTGIIAPNPANWKVFWFTYEDRNKLSEVDKLILDHLKESESIH
ncbi:NUDIX hydrolase [Arenibacter lacus]|uniref:NUDIX hydrolase n=1 Tax=Arenibacter lacus TaxID=2608629 RepID=UPI00123D2F47|nr:NUDIX hydrolase [Arenibacter lacus]